MKFEEALKAFNEGKTIRRLKYNWTFTKGHLLTTEQVFSYEDAIADDWVVVEEEIK